MAGVPSPYYLMEAQVEDLAFKVASIIGMGPPLPAQESMKVKEAKLGRWWRSRPQTCTASKSLVPGALVLHI